LHISGSSDDVIIADEKSVLRESLTNGAKLPWPRRSGYRIHADKQQLDLTDTDHRIGLGGTTPAALR
jgi:hypothetical protein